MGLELTFEDFQSYCNKKYCLRKTNYNYKCKTSLKQEKCYDKYVKVKLKKELRLLAKARLHNNFVVSVWMDDFGEFDGFVTKENWKEYCKLWKILTQEEKDFVEVLFGDLLWLNKNLDCAHVYPKDTHPDIRDDPKNGVVIGRFFHTRIDAFKHPVTGKDITKEERILWLQSAKKGERCI